MKFKIVLFIIIFALLVIIVSSIFLVTKNLKIAAINSFEDCKSAGYPILEIYPEQCKVPDGRTFVRIIACPMDAKICPDGSAVGRTGPNCEFTPCPSNSNACYIGGCSSQICSDKEDVVSTCEYKSEYVCYKNAECSRQSNGQCGWTQTAELKACLNGKTFSR